LFSGKLFTVPKMPYETPRFYLVLSYNFKPLTVLLGSPLKSPWPWRVSMNAFTDEMCIKDGNNCFCVFKENARLKKRDFN